MDLTLIIVLLVAHFVGDFICQSDWMALNKSKRWDALGLHVACYIAIVSLMMAVFQPPSQYPYTEIALFVRFLMVNAIAHFVQDAITSRINSKLWFIELGEQYDTGRRNGVYFPKYHASVFPNKRHWFFVGIGADQLLHYITLFVTAYYLL